MKLFDFELSGNCYKVRLLLNILQLPHERVAVDLLGGAQKKPDFLALNPKGQVPVLVDGAHVIADSQAILVYLARKSSDPAWLPTDSVTMAHIQFWLSTAAHEVTQGPAHARYYRKFRVEGDWQSANAASERLLQWVDPCLKNRAWLVGEQPTIADIAMFPYLALAHEGGLDLENYPSIRDWVARVKSIEGFIGMPGLEN